MSSEVLNFAQVLPRKAAIQCLQWNPAYAPLVNSRLTRHIYSRRETGKITLSASASHSSPPASAGSTFVSPFARLAALLEGVQPGASAINLSIGEPRHAQPAFVGPTLAANLAGFGKYPPIKGSDEFRASVAGWLGRRYGLGSAVDPATMVVALNGSREGLFYAALEARRSSRKQVADPVILIPNPFYPVYAAGALAAGCTPVMMPADAATGFLPVVEAIPADVLHRAVACFFASPANPQGAVASLEGWRSLIRLAREHDFLLFADECYSEIYRAEPPAGVLEAAASLGAGFGHVVSFNSLSKRSNLPGLRCGFAAGDPDFLTRWSVFRNIAAPQVPLPAQAVAVAAYADEAHVEDNRLQYNAKFAIAEELLGPLFGPVTPPGGFFLWLDVAAHGGGEAVAARLWREAGLRVIPGAYLATADTEGCNPGAPFIRIALVESLDLTREAMQRLARILA